jgi:hypothetical protein
MTVNPNSSYDDEDIVDGGNSDDVAVLTPPLADDNSPAVDDHSPLADVDALLDEIAIETTAPASSQPDEHGGARCENCDAAMATGRTFCKRCGFYPALKMFVDIDAEIDDETGAVDPKAKSHWQVWKSLVPGWGWALAAGVLVLLGVSIAARLMVPEGPSRALWTYAQYGVGMLAFITAHVFCYMFAIMHDSSLNFLDIVLKPFAIWMVTLRDLPKSFKRVALGCWGQAAMLFAAFVVAGVRYDEIIDWGKVPPKKKPKQNTSAPMDAPAEDMTMEEAMDELAKNAGAEPGDEKKQQQDKGNRQKMSRCLIIGFTPNRESDFSSLLLAIDEGGGRWRYAGVLSEGIPIEARLILNTRLRRLMRSTPVVPCDQHAFWLEPQLMCTVWYEDWTDERQLKRPFFDKLQADFEPIKAPRAP